MIIPPRFVSFAWWYLVCARVSCSLAGSQLREHALLGRALFVEVCPSSVLARNPQDIPRFLGDLFVRALVNDPGEALASGHIATPQCCLPVL